MKPLTPRDTPVGESGPLEPRGGDPGAARVAWRLKAGESFATSFPIRRRRASALLGFDAMLLALGLLISAASASRANASVGPVPWMELYGLLVIAVLASRGAYRFRLRTSPLDHIGQAVTSTALAAIVVIAARVLIDPSPEAASEIVRWWGFTTGYVAAGRVALSLFETRPGSRGLQTLIIGAGVIGRLVARRLQERPELGLRPVGFLDKEPRAGDSALPVLGVSWDLEEVVRDHQVRHVIVTFSTAPSEVMVGLVRRCRALELEVSVVPRLFEEVSNRATVEHLGGLALLRVQQSDPRGWQFEVKYTLDRVVGCAGALLLSPVLLVLALIVRLTSPGPVLFRQERVGLDGRVFNMLKFRTMRVEPNAGENDAAWAARALA
ncbi:MAG: sugar transferase, partial [Solirubrobacteraceae bacterium]